MASLPSLVGNAKRLQPALCYLPTNCLSLNSGGVEQFRFEIDAKPRSFRHGQISLLNRNRSCNEVIVLNEIVATDTFEYKQVREMERQMDRCGMQDGTAAVVWCDWEVIGISEHRNFASLCYATAPTDVRHNELCDAKFD